MRGPVDNQFGRRVRWGVNGSVSSTLIVSCIILLPAGVCAVRNRHCRLRAERRRRKTSVYINSPVCHAG